MSRSIFRIILIITIFQSSILAQTKLLFVGDDIPKQIYIQSHFISENSDTLVFNNKLLERGTDYVFNQKFMRLELLFAHDHESDTLLVMYRLLPSWLQQKYGTELPQITNQSKTSHIVLPTQLDKQYRTESDIVLKGSKSFRFSTSKSGSAGFNQTLDLNLSGHLANNLTLQGTISDRGYNPSYGTSNSRLNELDKINLKVQSPNFMAQVGDIIVGSNRSGRNREKRISGMNLAVQNKKMQIGMIAARPKGQYTSYSLFGIQNKQGPYQIQSQGARQAIIPGSETVWLDGVEMKQGSNDDYLIDYPNGQITFNVNHLIDTRSRIVIDYEPLSSEYKQEYLHANSNFHSLDTSYSFSLDWIREGDDKDENLSQIFSTNDQQLLENLGDEELVFKSGVVADTLGAYNLILDSLSDTVYQYVGENLGQYDVRFSFVDSGKGDYLYLGGNKYQYAGIGAGEYLPLILLHTPKRTDYFESSFDIKNKTLGTLQSEWSQSRTNKNLFQVNNTSINKNYYQFTYHNALQNSENEINAMYRKKEFGFNERNRVDQADNVYRFYLPIQKQFTSDEQLVSLQTNIKVHKTLSIQPQFSLLQYRNQFESKNNSIAIKFSPLHKLTFSGDMQSVKTDLYDSSFVRHGKSETNNIQLQYNMYKNYIMTSSYNKTKRTNDYNLILGGFVQDEYIVRFADSYSEISYSYYIEDTLANSWVKKRKRDKIQFKSENKFHAIDYKLQIYYQQTDNIIGKESSLLTRTNLIYSNRKQNLQIQSSYMLSDETRFSKGIRYLEVNDGEGDYVFVDSQYIPEAGGNFILVEELLSETAPVKRGEKSFSLSKKWSKAHLTFNSILNEELFATQSRNANWILPVYSNSNLAYLFFDRFTRGSLKVFPMTGGYVFTLNIAEKKEKRFINQIDRLKESINTELILNQKLNKYYFEEKIEYFKDERDAYYFREGDIDGYAIAGKIKHLTTSNEYAIQLRVRSAVSVDSKKSQMYMLLLEERFNLRKHGELKISSEFYKSNKNNFLNSESYLLNDNKPGTQGAVWSIIFRAKIKKEFRLNLTVQGRHSDINQARIFARTEFVAQF